MVAPTYSMQRKVVAVQRLPKGAPLLAGRVGVYWNMGCQRLIFKATHGRSSLTEKWQAWQVACTLSWILKHGTPEMGSWGRMAALSIGFLSALA